MRNVEGSAWIGGPRLLLIENKDKTGTGLSHFRLSFDQIGANPEDGDAVGDRPGAQGVTDQPPKSS